MADVDYYELLGVRADATSSEIKSAYRALARSTHPDAGGTADGFQLLREAYETLSDPALRAAYDKLRRTAARTARRTTASRTRTRERPRRFGEDPDFVPPAPRPDVATIPWWRMVDGVSRVHYAHPGSPGHAPAAGAACGMLLLPLPLVLPFAFSVWLFAVWLLLVVTAAAAAVLLVRRHLESLRNVRAFRSEFGEKTVFGTPGAERDQIAERLTAELFERYLTRLPGVRIFHGLAWPDSVFADIDHAVLCGRRLVLVESKLWLPGHYATDANGTLLRNGQRFRGGGTRLPESVAVFRRLLTEVEVRGALVIYPSRAGEVSTEDPRRPAGSDNAEPRHPWSPSDAPPMTPEQFVRQMGDWLATEPATVDRHVFRTVLGRVVGQRTAAHARS